MFSIVYRQYSRMATWKRNYWTDTSGFSLDSVFCWSTCGSSCSLQSSEGFQHQDLWMFSHSSLQILSVPLGLDGGHWWTFADPSWEVRLRVGSWSWLSVINIHRHPWGTPASSRLGLDPLYLWKVDIQPILFGFLQVCCLESSLKLEKQEWIPHELLDVSH